MNWYALVALATVISAILNRVRGGGFGGQYLPGRALIWVAPLMGGLSLFFTDRIGALAIGLGYLFWGMFSWGHTLASVGGITIDRPKTQLEKTMPDGIAGAILRMLFVLPMAVFISCYYSFYSYLTAAVLFAFFSTLAYVTFLQEDDRQEDGWTLAEVITGAAWALILIFPLMFFTEPYLTVEGVLSWLRKSL